jgi:hypothetical protein
MRSRAVGFLIGAALVVAGCAAIQQQKAVEVRADQGTFKNLKVLPQNITHDELIATMRTFARSLGVKCDHCHVPLPEGSAEHFDFASDAKEEKNTARIMMKMKNYISEINEQGAVVTCYTCHRGKSVPESLLPPEAPREPEAQPPSK